MCILGAVEAGLVLRLVRSSEPEVCTNATMTTMFQSYKPDLHTFHPTIEYFHESDEVGTSDVSRLRSLCNNAPILREWQYNHKQVILRG